jgi:DMSO reductase anchor subunit
MSTPWAFLIFVFMLGSVAWAFLRLIESICNLIEAGKIMFSNDKKKKS